MRHLGRHFCTFVIRFAYRDTKLDIYPEQVVKAGLPIEALMKLAGFFHSHKNTPVTWSIDYRAACQYGDLFATWHRDYGDEVAVWACEWGELDYLRELGIPYRGFSPADYSESELFKRFQFLRRAIGQQCNQKISTICAMWMDEKMVRALRKAGFSNLWGLTFHQEDVDGVTHKGGVWYPYYISEKNFKIPAQEPGGVLGLGWFITDMANCYLTCRNHSFGFVRITPHPGEEEQSGFFDDNSRHSEKVIVQWHRQREHNPFVYSTFHLEACWMDNNVCPTSYFVDHPKRVFQIYKTYMETIKKLRGVQVITLSNFARWHRAHFRRTSEQVFYSWDTIPDARSWFKDRKAPDTVYYATSKYKLVFQRDAGILPVEVTDFTRQHKTPRDVPYPSAPITFLDFRHAGLWQPFGLEVSDGRTIWRARACPVARKSVDNYGFMLWDVHLPTHVSEDRIRTSLSVRKFVYFKEHDSVLVLFSLVAGENLVELWASAGFVKLLQPKVRTTREIDYCVLNATQGILHLAKCIFPVPRHGGERFGGLLFEGKKIPSGFTRYYRDKRHYVLAFAYPQTLPLRPGKNTFTLLPL